MGSDIDGPVPGINLRFTDGPNPLWEKSLCSRTEEEGRKTWVRNLDLPRSQQDELNGKRSMDQEGDVVVVVGGWKPITLFRCKQWECLLSGPWLNSQAIKATASAFPCHAQCNGKWQLMKAFLHGLLTLLFCVGTCQGEVSLNTENSKPGECFTVIGMSWEWRMPCPHFSKGVGMIGYPTGLKGTMKAFIFLPQKLCVFHVSTQTSALQQTQLPSYHNILFALHWRSVTGNLFVMEGLKWWTFPTWV